MFVLNINYYSVTKNIEGFELYIVRYQLQLPYRTKLMAGFIFRNFREETYCEKIYLWTINGPKQQGVIDLSHSTF